MRKDIPPFCKNEVLFKIVAIAAPVAPLSEKVATSRQLRLKFPPGNIQFLPVFSDASLMKNVGGDNDSTTQLLPPPKPHTEKFRYALGFPGQTGLEEKKGALGRQERQKLLSLLCKGESVREWRRLSRNCMPVPVTPVIAFVIILNRPQWFLRVVSGVYSDTA